MILLLRILWPANYDITLGINPRKTRVCEYLERPGGGLFNLEALNVLISYVVYSLVYIYIYMSSSEIKVTFFCPRDI